MKKGLACLVGMNLCDKNSYGGEWDGKLRFAERDALAVADVTAAHGLTNTILLSKDGTKDRVVSEIRSAAKTLTSGDLFVLYYSGHGNRTRDKDGDEENGKDETMCLHDGQLIDDELYALWQTFQPGVRVLFITDCCHSGSMLRGSDDDVAKAMDDDTSEIIRYLDPEMYSRIRKELPPREPVGAFITHFAGCHEDQLSYENSTRQHGRLTSALLDALDDTSAGGYPGLFERMYALMPDKQKPVLARLGAHSEEYDAEAPFTV